jgi:hypothetical protein
MTEPTVEEFLRLEEGARRLVAELTALRAETVTLKEANSTLITAADRLSQLIGATTEAARQVGESAKAVREIGTPEILNRIGTVAGAVRDSAQTTNESINANSDANLRAHLQTAATISRSHRVLIIILAVSILGLLVQGASLLMTK